MADSLDCSINVLGRADGSFRFDRYDSQRVALNCL